MLYSEVIANIQEICTDLGMTQCSPLSTGRATKSGGQAANSCGYALSARSFRTKEMFLRSHSQPHNTTEFVWELYITKQIPVNTVSSTLNAQLDFSVLLAQLTQRIFDIPLVNPFRKVDVSAANISVQDVQMSCTLLLTLTFSGDNYYGS